MNNDITVSLVFFLVTAFLIMLYGTIILTGMGDMNKKLDKLTEAVKVYGCNHE